MRSPETFQRARRPEQVAERRQAILTASARLLRERRVVEVSLADIGAAVGLAKSNVLRYFDSKEAIFLEVLDVEWRDWLDSLDGIPAPPVGDRWAAERQVASLVADTLATRPVLCELISVMAGVLERNIQIEFARDFKQRAAQNTDRLAALVCAALPDLPAAAGQQFAGAVFIVTAGLWPYARPTDVVATVSAELGVEDTESAFRSNLRSGLVAQLIGLRAQVEVGREG